MNSRGQHIYRRNRLRESAGAGHVTRLSDPVDDYVTAAGLTLMAVCAHPDDESTSVGGALARYVDEGVRTSVCSKKAYA